MIRRRGHLAEMPPFFKLRSRFMRKGIDSDELRM